MLLEILYTYLVFAIATGLTALIRIYIPILNLAIHLKIDNSITRSPILSSIVMLLFLIAMAPIVIYSLISIKAFENARYGTYLSVCKQED